MQENTFGKLFSITSFGESHGKAIGVVIDGMLPKILVSESDLKKHLEKRRPLKRRELDIPEIVSGIFKGYTLGTPICVLVRNKDAKSSDYKGYEKIFRVGHADQVTLDKYGIRDPRGGGRASARETLSRVIAGYFAGLLISDVSIQSKVIQMGPCGMKEKELKTLASNFDSVGVKIETKIRGLPKGLGGPVFDKLKSDFARALMSIGACVGVSLGRGEEFLEMRGKEMIEDPSNFGGILGGISTGEEILIHSIFKPIATVGDLAKKGRHDFCVAPRVIPVIDSMLSIVIVDHLLRQKILR